MTKAVIGNKAVVTHIRQSSGTFGYFAAWPMFIFLSVFSIIT